jgi:hypothetical protein
VTAWHPLFSKSEQKLQLGQGEVKALDFTLTPAR